MHAQRAAVGMGEKRFRQGGEKGLRGDLGRGLPALVHEAIVRRRADTIAGEMKRDQAMDVGVGRDIARRQPIRGARFRERLPVLADQRPLRRRLLRVGRFPAHAVRSGERDGG